MSKMWYSFRVRHTPGYCFYIITCELCLEGVRNPRRGQLYTTPGSYLQINLTDSHVIPECKFISTETNPKSENIIIDSHGKYQSRTTLTIQVPQQIGSVHIVTRGDQTKELNEKGKTLLYM